MGKYKLSKEEMTVYKAEMRSGDNKTIISYEFKKEKNGWFIEKSIWKIDSNFPKKESIWLPAELIEQILLVESVKDNLT